MKEFLEHNGYKMWNEEIFEYGSIQKYQKRIDTLHKYKNIPVCECNDKLFINIHYSDFDFDNHISNGCSLSMIHENKNGDWCDLKIYSIPLEKFEQNLEYYEDKLVKLWKAFAS